METIIQFIGESTRWSYDATRLAGHYYNQAVFSSQATAPQAAKLIRRWMNSQVKFLEQTNQCAYCITGGVGVLVYNRARSPHSSLTCTLPLIQWNKSVHKVLLRNELNWIQTTWIMRLGLMVACAIIGEELRVYVAQGRGLYLVHWCAWPRSATQRKRTVAIVIFRFMRKSSIPAFLPFLLWSSDQTSAYVSTKSGENGQR